jgi:alpha-N-arabinofuranosidase
MKQRLFMVLLGLSLGMIRPASALAQTYRNPILPGGYPDPSITYDGEYYYMVNSSFELFPGLPIHRSSDLVNWEAIGHGLHRDEQISGAVNLVSVQENGGIHAPTIRFHNGRFYLITTNIYTPLDPKEPTEFVNFILTAENPAGPWSMPHVIDGAPGIDPDIFFDSDGRVYFVGTHDIGDPKKNGIGEIWIQELDLEAWSLVGERHSVWRGACGGESVEGPHLYRRNGYYYLMVAEGGTGLNHAVMIAVSDSIFGPYLSNPRNPILTARHLSSNNWVNCVGHADFTQIEDGRWYMVALGIRNIEDGTSPMGRETFLMPMVWEDATITWQETSPGKWEPLVRSFPVIAPETGRVEPINPLPFAQRPQINRGTFEDSFTPTALRKEWAFRRGPRDTHYSLTARRGALRLYTTPEKIAPRTGYNALGIRQTQADFEWTATLQFNPENRGEKAGIVLIQGDENYQLFTLEKSRRGMMLQLKTRNGPKEKLVLSVEQPAYAGTAQLRVISANGTLHYAISLDEGESFLPFTSISGVHLLCKDYVGAQIGVYASSNGNMESRGFADFLEVHYRCSVWP